MVVWSSFKKPSHINATSGFGKKTVDDMKWKVGATAVMEAIHLQNALSRQRDILIASG